MVYLFFPPPLGGCVSISNSGNSISPPVDRSRRNLLLLSSMILLFIKNYSVIIQRICWLDEKLSFRVLGQIFIRDFFLSIFLLLKLYRLHISLFCWRMKIYLNEDKLSDNLSLYLFIKHIFIWIYSWLIYIYL